MLRWNEVPEDFSGKFEIAISSDCLFFDEGRPQLVRKVSVSFSILSLFNSLSASVFRSLMF